MPVFCHIVLCIGDLCPYFVVVVGGRGGGGGGGVSWRVLLSPPLSVGGLLSTRPSVGWLIGWLVAYVASRGLLPPTLLPLTLLLLILLSVIGFLFILSYVIFVTLRAPMALRSMLLERGGTLLACGGPL